MNEPLTAVATEEPDLKEALRALHESLWRINAVFKAVENDILEDEHISHGGEMLVEAGIEALSVCLNLVEQLPKALEVDISSGDKDSDAFKDAYIRARAEYRATLAMWQS